MRRSKTLFMWRVTIGLTSHKISYRVREPTSLLTEVTGYFELERTGAHGGLHRLVRRLASTRRDVQCAEVASHACNVTGHCTDTLRSAGPPNFFRATPILRLIERRIRRAK